MNSGTISNRFTCPHCGGASKLPMPLPQEGLFRLSCALCNEKTLIRFSPDGFVIESKIRKEPPAFLERKIQKDPSSSSGRQTAFPSESGSGNPFGFRSLKERIQSNPRWNIESIHEKWKNWWSDLKISWTNRSDRTEQFDRSSRRPIQNNTPTYSPTGLERPRKKLQTPSGYRNRSLLASFYWLILVFLFAGASFLAILGTGILTTKSELPEILGSLSKGKPTKILDRNGQVVSEIFQKRTSTLQLSDYPDSLITALLNVEDRNFYSHGGIDYVALLRAVFQNIIHLRYKQGASTITQQLARILIDDRTKTLTRKWKELVLALTLEAYLSKDEILEYYMNHVYLGHGAFGFGEAVKFYFNKNPRDLNRTEAILLATLPSAPNRNSPLKNPAQSRIRLDYILETFKKRGVIQDIPKEEITRIFTEFQKRSPNETVYGNRQDLAPYVTEHVRLLLKKFGNGRDIYEEGGYIVETTINKGLQEQVSNLVQLHLQKILKSGQVRKTSVAKNQVRETSEVVAMKSLLQNASLAMQLFSGTFYEESDSGVDLGLQAAIIAIDPKTGEVLCMHGGNEFKSNNQFNRSIQMRRQTGSSIKPILFASAINAGKISTGDRILDAPLIFRGTEGMPNWTPDNLGKTYDGEISLRYALVKSKNTAAVQIAEKLGYNQLDAYFAQFFFPDPEEKKKRFRNDLSLALGSLELSPLEMASAYSAFLNEGKITRPFLVRKIIDPSGNLVYSSGNHDEFDLKVPTERTVIKQDTSEVILSLLKDSGRSSGVYSSGYKGILAGKTGTTNENKDAWFVGLRPGISMAIWVGYDNPRYGMGSGGLGGTAAAPLWGEIMKQADSGKHLPVEPFPSPVFALPGRICFSQKTTCTDCPSEDQEWFTQDNLSSGKCSDRPTGNNENREVLQDIF